MAEEVCDAENQSHIRRAACSLGEAAINSCIYQAILQRIQKVVIFITPVSIIQLSWLTIILASRGWEGVELLESAC